MHIAIFKNKYNLKQFNNERNGFIKEKKNIFLLIQNNM